MVAWAAMLSCAIIGCSILAPAKKNPAFSPKQMTLRIHLAIGGPLEGYTESKDEQGRVMYVADEPILTEKDVRSAALLHSLQRNLVMLEFKPLAADRLDRVTSENSGGRLAIYLDDKLLMTSMIRAPISAGKVILEGDFTRERAAQVARGLGGAQGS